MIQLSKRLVVALAVLLLCPYAAQGEDILVPEDYATIQEAVDKAEVSDRILVAPGTYIERVTIETAGISIIGTGEDRTDATIWSNHNTVNQTTDLALHVEVGAIVWLENIQVKNVYVEQSGIPDHAKCCNIEGTLYADNVRLFGGTDTLQVNGVAHVTSSSILGISDYVFGRGSFVCFDCKLVNRLSGSAVLAPRGTFGNSAFVVVGSKFLGAGTNVHLARSSNPLATVILIGNYMEDHILPEGFFNPTPEEPSLGWRYWECGNTGPGADRSGRVPWASGCPGE